MKNEMKYFNGIMHGEPVPDEFRPLMTGQAARAAIATADAATRSLREDRKVKISEVTGSLGTAAENVRPWTKKEAIHYDL